MVPVVLALCAAAFFASSTVVQHRSAATAPAGSATGVRLVLVLLRQPLWLAGLVLGLVGGGLQAVAVSQGALLVVQPLLVTGLLMALPLSVWLEHRRPSRAEWGWAVAVVVGLALFLTAARPGSGEDTAVEGALKTGVLIAVGTSALAAGLSTARGGRYRALLLGLGGGCALGAAGGLLKEVTGRLDDGGLAAALSWPLLALALVGATGVVLNQSSYRVGVLTASQPAITIAEPVTAAGLGAWAFGERLSDHPLALVLQVLGLALMVTAVVQLSRLTAGQDPTGAAVPTPAGATAAAGHHDPTDPRRAVGRPPEEELC